MEISVNGGTKKKPTKRSTKKSSSLDSDLAKQGEGEGEKSFVEEAGRIFGKYRVDGLG